MRKRVWLRWVAIGAVTFVAVVLLARQIANRSIRARIERSLDFAQDDAYATVMSAVDVSLSFLAHSVGDAIGTCRPIEHDLLQETCRICGVDEVNLADTNGVWVASSEFDIVGLRLDRSPMTAELMGALGPGHPVITQDFRGSVEHPELRRKYAAVALDDGTGLVEIGLDERRLTRDYESNFADFFEGWETGDSRFYVVARPNGEIFSMGRKELKGFKTLASLGLDLGSLPKDGKTTFVADFDGEKCYCRMQGFLDHLIMVAIPERGYLDMRRTMVAMPAVMLLLVFAIAARWSFVVRKRRLAQAELRRVEAERRANDLAMAQEIQRASLPTVFPPYPRDLAIDIFAEMRPARDVGGDFYDFHYAGYERLAVLIADVSGKGVPAAMMMMKAKTVIREQVMSITDLGEAMAAANERLCEGNSMEMFVTCWLGVLNERTGEVRYVNAGHNPPWIRSADGRLRTLEAVSGLPLGAMPGVKYSVQTTHLAPGDLLYLYTDGVTEANDVAGAMFGDDRLAATLREAGDVRDPARVCRLVSDRLGAFVGSAAPFDDVTMLALSYRGQPQVEEREFPAEIGSVPLMNAFAEQLLDRTSCPDAEKCDLLVSLDEVANNVASYSGAKRMWLKVESVRSVPIWRFTVSDDGVPWNPLEHLDPDITLSADDRSIGGLGILMVKKLMDDVSYVRSEGRNSFRFRRATRPLST